MAAIEKICPDARGMVLIPENHTRNQYYLQNVAVLQTILRHAGIEVRTGTLQRDLTAPVELTLTNGTRLLLEPLTRRGNRVFVDGFDPCVVLLNNDLSSGAPEVLADIEQSLLPPLHAGWTVRRKSNHFAAYARVAEEFARLLDIDPWLVNPYFERCGLINFQERKGEECLEGYVASILDDVREKYRQYGIKDDPFVIIKADAGTYGMGIMTVKDPSEVKVLNRNQRKKMAVVKEGLEVHEVMVQEGIHTYVVGGFYRVHTGRTTDQNLNAPGMQFKPLAFAAPCSSPDPDDPGCPPNRFYAYGVIARLALLAASIELEQTDPTAGAVG
jgi:glutamate--cysteine ligase